MNTEFRKKAENELEKNFYKLCVRENHGERSKESKHQNHATQWKKKNRKLTASPSCAGCTLFSNDLAGFRMQKESVTLDKPVYAEMTILDNSKILMNDFLLKRAYEVLQGKVWGHLYGHRQPFARDSNQWCLKDMEGSKYHISDYSKDHPLYSSANKMGKTKDEMNGTPIVECRPKKMHSILMENKNIKKSKGTKHKWIKRG